MAPEINPICTPATKILTTTLMVAAVVRSIHGQEARHYLIFHVETTFFGAMCV
jgi:hypothetical protein